MASDNFPKLLQENLMTGVEIAEKAKVSVAKEREATGEVLKLLRVIEDRKIYAELGFSGFWDFATKYLGYDEGQAYRRINAMRLMKGNPQVEEKISSGKISLTTAAMVQTFIRKNKISSEIALKKVEGKSSREAERSLLELAPNPVPEERVRAISKEHTEIRIVPDKNLKELLDRLKALRSHKNPSLTYTELIEDMAKLAERHWDPALKRSKAPSAPKSDKRAVPSALKSYIWKRDQGKCTFEANGKKCGSTHLLEIDHIQPWARGGSHEAGNLRLLCREHNQFRARFMT
jgi:hypothetical protein